MVEGPQYRPEFGVWKAVVPPPVDGIKQFEHKLPPPKEAEEGLGRVQDQVGSKAMGVKAGDVGEPFGPAVEPLDLL